MKSVRSNSCCKDILPFPKLMEGTKFGTIVLMTSKNTGTVVSVGNSQYKLGFHSTNWISKFIDYTGDICLTNGE